MRLPGKLASTSKTTFKNTFAESAMRLPMHRLVRGTIEYQIKWQTRAAGQKRLLYPRYGLAA